VAESLESTLRAPAAKDPNGYRTIDTVTTWGGGAVAPPAGTATEYIEGGDVLVLRDLLLEIASEERSLLTAPGRSKNISFDPARSRLDGCAFTGRERAARPDVRALRAGRHG
jgi:hypothetical protein